MDENKVIQDIVGTNSFDTHRYKNLFLVETKKGNLNSLSKHSKAGLIPTIAMALAPLSSYAEELSFRVGDLFKKSNYNELGEPLQGIRIRLEDLNEPRFLAELTTDENGACRYDPNAVIGPDFRFNPDVIKSVRIFDVGLRLEETHYGSSFTSLPNKPSGLRFLCSILKLFPNDKFFRLLIFSIS